MDSEGASAGKKESCRNPTNLSLLATYQKKLPLQMKNRTGPTINARFWDRIYHWIYRHNMSKWDIASRCEMKKSLCKLFVVSWRNCWFEKWQNVRRFDTLMSKNTWLCKSVLPCFWTANSTKTDDSPGFPTPTQWRLDRSVHGPIWLCTYCHIPITLW